MRSLDLLAPRNLFFSWLAAAVALPGALLVAVIGQGLGALIGGCSWIGLSVPLHRQVWALVNQPNLAFAGQPEAAGYWLGSSILPLLLVILAVVIMRRPKGLAAELVVIQWSWSMVVVGLAWLPLLDGEDGHAARFLHFFEASPWLVGIFPLAAVFLGTLPALRLLSAMRLARRHAGRMARETALVLHLLVPAVLFLVLATGIRGVLAIPGTVAVALVTVTPLVLAWRRFPVAPFHRPDEVETSAFGLNLVALMMLAAVFWVAGRPLPEGSVAGVTWLNPSATNNIRPWIVDQPPLEAVRDSLARISHQPPAADHDTPHPAVLFSSCPSEHTGSMPAAVKTRKSQLGTTSRGPRDEDS